MKLEFKFTLSNFIGFIIVGALFYWLCPLPAAPLPRALVCLGVGVLLFAMCFVVVTHKSFIRPARPQQAKPQKHKK